MAEAAFMTGLERNADVVNMASYAPLFAHVEGWQWTPDLIWFDGLSSYGTPDYYVHQLFSLNKGTTVVPITLNNEPVTGQDGCYATAAVDEHTHELIIKIVNTASMVQQAAFAVKGTQTAGHAQLISLQSDDLNGVNAIADPLNISPIKSEVEFTGNDLKLTLKPYSFTIIRVSINK